MSSKVRLGLEGGRAPVKRADEGTVSGVGAQVDRQLRAVPVDRKLQQRTLQQRTLHQPGAVGADLAPVRPGFGLKVIKTQQL